MKFMNGLLSVSFFFAIALVLYNVYPIFKPSIQQALQKSGVVIQNPLERALIVGKSTKQNYRAFSDAGGLENREQVTWRGYQVLSVRGWFSRENELLSGFEVVLINGAFGQKLPSIDNLKASLKDECGTTWTRVRDGTLTNEKSGAGLVCLVEPTTDRNVEVTVMTHNDAGLEVAPAKTEANTLSTASVKPVVPNEATQKEPMQCASTEKISAALSSLNQYYSDVPSRIDCTEKDALSVDAKLICGNANLRLLERLDAQAKVYGEENATKSPVEHKGSVQTSVFKDCVDEACICGHFKESLDASLGGGMSPFSE